MTDSGIPHSAFRTPHFHALVADDDPRWRALISEVLQDAGGSVTAAPGPVDDLTGYDLAVLDLALDPANPGDRGGFELIARLADSGTRCIVVSGLEEADRPPGLLDLPHVIGLLPKESFSREALLDLVRQALARPSAPPAKVLIVEDDEGWRGVYADVLAEDGYDLQVAISYGEARGLLGRADPEAPSASAPPFKLARRGFALAVVDLHLISSADPQENRDGFWLLRAARQRGVPAIVVSALGAPEDIDRAYDEYGVFAFVEKEAFDRATFRRIVSEAIRAGEAWRADENTLAPKPPAPSTRLSGLTEREKEVLDLLTQGCTNRQIGERLAISANTVKKHVDHILQKLGVSNRASAVAMALRGDAERAGV